MKTTLDMAKGTVTGMVLKDIPEDPLRLESATPSVQDRPHARDDAVGALSRRSGRFYASRVR